MAMTSAPVHLETEEQVLAYWQKLNAFERSLELTKDGPEFVFYDGPPFATGLPHYGHVVASTLKDMVPRYMTQMGYHVERRWGWDCLAEGTKISLSNGTSINIEDLDQMKVDVLTFDQSKGRVISSPMTNFFSQGEKECLELVFENGSSLICTPDHKIMTSDGYVNADELVAGKTEVVAYFNNPSIEYVNTSVGTWSLDLGSLSFSDSSTEEKMRSMAFCRILGFMMADGCIFYNLSKAQMVSYIYLGHELDAMQFSKDVELVCNLRPKYRLAKNVYVIDLPKKLVESLENLSGLTTGKRINQKTRVPVFLMKNECPRYLKQEFLGGIFGGDGHTAYLTRYKNGNLVFKYPRFTQSKIEKLKISLRMMLDDIVILLKEVGVTQISFTKTRENTASKKNTNPDKLVKVEMGFIIKKEAVIPFAEKVGFRYCIDKTVKLNACVDYLKMTKIKAINSKYSCETWLKSTGTLDLFTNKYVIERDIMDLPVQKMVVYDIKKAGVRKLYDICVPETSCFVANGIVVHNCHGLPIEYEIEKILGIKTKQEVEAFGIGNYNEECRKIVMTYREQWRTTVQRLGRWVDFENDYKTMDPSFMESVWWVFKQLWDQGRVYQGVKVMPYSTGCGTPLSNFEAKSNYKKVKDPSITVKFKLRHEALGNRTTYLLVWTTTPWTLPSNLAICAHPEIEYVTVEMNRQFYILSKKSVDTLLKGQKYVIHNTMKGSELEGWSYEPMYPYYEGKYPNSFQILLDNYVSEETGTGLVHQAPAFGEDDYRVCQRAGIVDRAHPPPCPINDAGNFALPSNYAQIQPIEGVNFKASDPLIIKDLKDRKLMFKHTTESHEYPYCWRSNTPLIYRTVKSWFVEVVPLQDQLLAKNEEIHWEPNFIGENKFKSWLSNCQDWCVSRNRYWGTPIPIWVSPDGEERVCIGSIAELEQMAGLVPGSITDLHRHHLDHIEIPSQRPGYPPLRRIPEVFDCWFESGSMPYGQFHYPFENKERFEANFPCHFIAEGSDQTRGWFYTLLVLSTALFDRPAFQNVIVNGMVLAEDGEKMSKSKKNYPPVNNVLDQYGADALRLYLIDSKVVRADALKFNEADLKIVVKNVNIMLKNVLTYWTETLSFFEHTTKTTWQLQPVLVTDLDPTDTPLVPLQEPIDSWMLHCLERFITGVHSTMKVYNLGPILNSIEQYIDELSRWYVKLNKVRFRQLVDPQDVAVGLSVLTQALYQFSIVLAPFAPFLSEMIYQRLRSYYPNSQESVHFQRMPQQFNYTRNEQMVLSMKYLISLLNQIRTQRSQRQVTSIKMPYGQIVVVHPDQEVLAAIKAVENILKTEGNILAVEYQTNSADYVDYQLTPNYKLLGPKLGKRLKELRSFLEQLDSATVNELVQTKQALKFGQLEIPFSELEVSTQVKTQFSKWQIASEQDLVVLLDPEVTPELAQHYVLKCFTREVQSVRRQIGLSLTDQNIMILVEYLKPSEAELTKELIEANRDSLEKLVGQIVFEPPEASWKLLHVYEEFSLPPGSVKISIYQN